MTKKKNWHFLCDWRCKYVNRSFLSNQDLNQLSVSLYYLLNFVYSRNDLISKWLAWVVKIKMWRNCCNDFFSKMINLFTFTKNTLICVSDKFIEIWLLIQLLSNIVRKFVLLIKTQFFSFKYFYFLDESSIKLNETCLLILDRRGHQWLISSNMLQFIVSSIIFDQSFDSK